MRNLLKYLAAAIKVDTYQRLMNYPILRTTFRQIGEVPVFERREQLWDYCIDRQIRDGAKMTYVEFGVHQGYSIRYFSEHVNNPDSVFIGLDSFEGLPEDWGRVQSGTFSTKGSIPQIDDKRVKFIKGWFRDTWEELEARLASLNTLIVHYDADLYSSTLFALAKIDTLNKSYVAIFDEFTGDELRALYNYCQAFGASVTFLGKTLHKNCPNQVACMITPHIRSARDK